MKSMCVDDRQKRHHQFRLNFLRHVDSFMKSHKLIGRNVKMALSVSGGVDSMVLLDVFQGLGLSFELIHFNHGTRPSENAKEEEMVRALGKKYGVNVHVSHFHFSLEDKNFEEKARSERRKVYQSFLKKNFWVYTAHHIDDSFEWSLMQSFKQSNTKSTLGIPLVSHGIIRPFMCVTKKQILRYARAKKVKWIEDQSNDNEKFERNYLRKNITRPIVGRYPKALSHYVSLHNELAHLHSLHRLISDDDLRVVTELPGSVVMTSVDFRKYKHVIKEWIHKLSHQTRGEIEREVEKLISSQSEMNQHLESFPFKGPWHFSGGVRAYLMKNVLLILNQNACDFYGLMDSKLVAYFQARAQIPELVKLNHFPYLVLLKKPRKLKKTSKYIHPLLPRSTDWLKNQGISYSYAPIMHSFDRQMLTEGAVILDSSVLGL